jgi:hypothetical protein
MREIRCPVRREGDPNSIGSPYPYPGRLRTTICIEYRLGLSPQSADSGGVLGNLDESAEN